MLKQKVSMIITEFEMVKYFYSHRPICVKCMCNEMHCYIVYEGWNFNSGNYLFTTDTK